MSNAHIASHAQSTTDIASFVVVINGKSAILGLSADDALS
jgi:hypothetical protein